MRLWYASQTKGVSVTIAPFANHLPVRVRFGEGAALELGGIAASHGARRVLLVIDEGLEERNVAVADAVLALRRADLEVDRFDKPAGEPTADIVDAAAAAVSQSRPHAIVALGGGSVIDTAKAARVCAQEHTRFRELETPYPHPIVPLIAVPTTAGTGSEVSGGAVVTDPATGRKAGIAAPALRAQDAVVDPVLTYSVPPDATAQTGIDALAQAIAGMIATVRTPIGDAIALEAVRLVSRSLVAAHRDGSDVAARSDMACGSLMAGLTMNIADCTAEHSLGQAIGGMFHAPHGLTIGVVLVQTLERERRVVPEQLERVADALGVPADGTADGSRAVRGVRNLLEELRFPVLRSIGVDESHVDALTDLAVNDPFLALSPKPWTAAEVRGAFVAALAEEPR
jgi:choline dehydrogenase